MITFLKDRHLRVLNLLDLLSNRVRTRTYDFPNLSLAQHSSVGGNNPAGAWDRRIILEALLVLILIMLLVVVSRNAQYSIMANSPASYFLSELKNVSTTHDTGFYMQSAKEWVLDADRRVLRVQDGGLLGYLLAVISLALDMSLEQTARIFLYGAVAATAYSAYLLLLVLGQSLLGVLVASSLVFFFPVYGRTSLGMVDTDQLNLFFVLFTIASLAASSRAKAREACLFFAIVAALTCQIFWLWFARPGFLVIFVVTYLALQFSFRVKLSRALPLTLLFTLAAGAGQFSSVFESLETFLNFYVFRPFGNEDSSTTVVGEAIKLQAVIAGTISETTKYSVSLAKNDFGSVIAFFLAVTGFVIWILQDWRRFSAMLPFVAFFALYLTAGQRFSLFSAPAALIGLFVFLSTFFWLLRRIVTTLVSADGFAERAIPHKLPLSDSVKNATGHLWPSVGRHIIWAIFLGAICWIGGVFPPLGVTPPPVIRAEELNMINKSLKDVSKDDAIISTWWDYGHELRYQTGFQVLTDGGYPTSIKNVYLARALVSTNPMFAADEMRFAAYFHHDTLKTYYPLRPSIELSTNTHRDLYLFLPSDLQDKMITIYNLAAATVSKDAMRGYNSDESAFVILYHQQPKNWGPFQLVQGQKEGGVLYRLPAPTVPGK